MLNNAAIFLIQTLCEFFAGVLLLRFWMQASRSASRNPLSAFVQALTNFVVLPARRVIPGLWGHDLATLVLAWLVVVVEVLLLLLLRGVAPDAVVATGLSMALVLLRLAIYLAIGAIFLQVILSWVNAASPLVPVVAALTRPLLRPLQRLVPPIGMVDLSPLIALLLLQLLLMVPLAYLERWVSGGF